MPKLEGKIALVTGAANGIGAALARSLADEGAVVILTDVSEQRGTSLADDLPGGAIFLRHDVTVEGDWIRVIEEVRSRFGRLDVLVNNAGLGFGALVTEMSLASFQRQQAVNVDGVFLGLKHSLPLMRSSGGGSIVNMSSTAGKVGVVGMSAYCATKGAVTLLTKAVAVECAQHRDGVRVNSVHPGAVKTDIWSNVPTSAVLPGIDATPFTNATNGEIDIEAVGAFTIPLGRVATTADVAAAVVFLASDESKYITGSEIMVDGGVTAR